MIVTIDSFIQNALAPGGTEMNREDLRELAQLIVEQVGPKEDCGHDRS